MSTATTAQANAGTTASVGRTRLRLTQRGRRVVTFLIAAPLSVGIGFAALGGSSALASLETAPTEFETVSVAYGDNLWSIAEDVAPSSDPREVIYEIKQLNALSTSELFPGQELAIPAKYTESAE